PWRPRPRRSRHGHEVACNRPSEFVSAAANLGLLLLFALILVGTWLVGTLAVCVLAGIKVEKIAVFFGRPLITFSTPLCPMQIGYIPLGAYVQRDMNHFAQRSLGVRWLLP